MASDPNQLLSALLSTGGITGSSFTQGQQNAQQAQMAPLELQGAQQQVQLNQHKLDAADAEQADQQKYQSDVQNWVSSGSTAQGLTNLIAMHPDQYKALQAGWQAKSDAQTKADLGFWGSVHGMLDKGDNAGASQVINQRLQAEKAAGIDTTEEQALADQVASGNKTALDGVKAHALAQVAAATGPEKFADAYGTVNKDDENFTLTPGARRFDATGKQIAAAPAGVHYEKIETVDENGNPVTQLVALGGEGGDPVSSGAGGASGNGQPRRVGGWTPSTVDGGDNPPSVVTAKVAALAHSLGIDPHAPLTAAQRTQLAKAIAPTEGGPGSIADKNNNPTNIQDGAFARSQPGYAGKGAGGYAKFTTKDAGLAAAGSLLDRYAARGQNTIDDIVRGKQVGGAAPAPAPAGMPPGARVLYSVKASPKGAGGVAVLDQDTLNGMADQYIAGDKSVVVGMGRSPANLTALRAAIINRARQQGMDGRGLAAQMVQYTGDQAASRAAGTQGAKVDMAVTEFQNLVPLALKASDSVPRSSFLPFSKAEQVYNNNTNDPKYKQFVASNNSLVNVYARAISPTGQPHQADKDHAREILDTATSPEAYRAVVGQLMQEAHAAQQSPGQVRRDIYNNVGSAGGSAKPTHVSASGKFAYYPGRGWVPR